MLFTRLNYDYVTATPEVAEHRFDASSPDSRPRHLLAAVELLLGQEPVPLELLLGEFYALIGGDAAHPYATLHLADVAQARRRGRQGSNGRSPLDGRDALEGIDDALTRVGERVCVCRCVCDSALHYST
jgi:hypothetical protein